MSEALRSREVIVGVDTHKHVHAAVAINELGARLGSMDVFMGVDADDDLAGTKSLAHGKGLLTG